MLSGEICRGKRILISALYRWFMGAACPAPVGRQTAPAPSYRKEDYAKTEDESLRGQTAAVDQKRKN